jgi:AraC-like DNA-binding protein
MNGEPGSAAITIAETHLDYRDFRERVLEQHWGLDAGSPLEGPFSLRQETVLLAESTISTHLNGHARFDVARTRRLTRTDSNRAELGVALVLSGPGEVSVGSGRPEEIVKPGDVFLTRSDDPWNLLMTRGYSAFLVLLPLGRGLVEPRKLPSTGGLVPLLTAHLKTLSTTYQGLQRQELETALGSLTMLTEALSWPQDRERVRPAVHGVLRQRIIAMIDDNLGDPELSPAVLAARQQMSLRYLQKLFADAGQTVRGVILSRRLKRCRQELEGPSSCAATISEIAFRYGFNDYRHFNRAFKEEFGESPREFRDRIVLGRHVTRTCQRDSD